MQIKQIIGRKIYNSRGEYALEVDVYLSDGSMGRASSPSGVTKSIHAAQPLQVPDVDGSRSGADIELAIELIHAEIAPTLIGREAWDQFAIDRLLIELDGTLKKSRLGANTILAVSVAVAKASAAFQNKPLHSHIAAIAGNTNQILPQPIIDLIDGGHHAATKLDFQEIMIMPVDAQTLPHSLEMAAAIKESLRDILGATEGILAMGDEGGFSPVVTSNHQALDLALQAIRKAGYEPGKDILLAVDVAASELSQDNLYALSLAGEPKSTSEMIEWYGQLCADYPIAILEDPLNDQDWNGWGQLNIAIGTKTLIASDSLTVSSTDLIDQAISGNVAKSIVIKPVQIGTLTETIRAVQLAQRAGLSTIMSHRSRETEDLAIVHLAVGLGCQFIKAGALERGERVEKYNELLRIAEFQSLPMSQFNPSTD